MNEEIIVQEEPVTEVTENTDAQTVEENEEGIELTDTTTEEVEKEEVKSYTDEELEQLVNNRINEILPNKIEREKRKMEKNYKKELAKYKETESILSAGLGKTDLNEINSDMRNFYKDQGIDIPVYSEPKYSDDDEKALGEMDADKIIELGYEDMQDEANRLADIGSEMTVREKAMFSKLATELTNQKNRKELVKIGVNENILQDAKFKDFCNQFNDNVPITKRYEMYSKMYNTIPEYDKPGSMKGVNKPGVKEYYSPEEIDRLTDEELDNDRVWEAVRKSMTGQS